MTYLHTKQCLLFNPRDTVQLKQFAVNDAVPSEALPGTARHSITPISTERNVMSNSNDLRSMTQHQRMQVVLDSFGYRPDRRMLADAGLEALKMKEQAKQEKKSGRSTAPVVIHRTIKSKMGAVTVDLDQYLGNDFIRGTHERRWTDAANARKFSPRDAQRALKIKGEGEIIPFSQMPIPADALSTGRHLGLGL